jgi:serine/threonine protein kinase
MYQVCKGLILLHCLGYIHGGVKSDNVIILSDGRVKLGMAANAAQAIAITTAAASYCCRWSVHFTFVSTGAGPVRVVLAPPSGVLVSTSGKKSLHLQLLILSTGLLDSS